MAPKNRTCGLPFAPSTMATPVLRSEASIARTRMGSMRRETEREKNTTHRADRHADEPINLSFCQSGDCGNRNRDLEHCHPAGKNFVLVKVRFGRAFFGPRFFLNLGLFFLVLMRFGAVLFGSCPAQCHFRIEQGCFDSFGLIISPMVR